MHWRLTLVQLFFTLGWTVYVIFLPGLLKRAGIDASWLLWILILDQLLFATADVACGFWLDRSKQLLRRAGNWLTALVIASCALFILLPTIAGHAPSWLLLTVLFLWVIFSSVLRVPPLVLLTKAVAPDASSARLATPIAAYLFGIGVAGALAPYLTVVLKNHEPLLPFVMASAALAAATIALRPQLAMQTDVAIATVSRPPSAVSRRGAFPLLIAVALFAFGMQLHTAVNSAKLFAAAAPGMALEWLMPLFWAGFSVAMFPASVWLAKRSEHSGDARAASIRAMWMAGIAGGMALVACAFSPSLSLLIVLQIIAGAAWAFVFLAAISAAADIGRTGREGSWIGTMLALFALAAAGRIALVLLMSVDNVARAVAGQLPWVAAILCLLATALILRIAR